MKHGVQADPQDGEQVVYVQLGRIVPNSRQPRKRFPAGRLRELARSIESQGVMQPLLLRPHPAHEDQYELVAGERRLRAIRLLGWPAAPALVRRISDEHLLESALVENLQREQLTPIEEAQAYRQLLDDHGYTQESLAERVGRERSTIANLVRLLHLPLAVQEDLEEERLSAGHARALLALEDAALQLALREQILARGLSVRETERLVKRAQNGGPARRKRQAQQAASGRDPRLVAAQEALENRLGTRVAVTCNGDGGGRIEIEYYSLEDFNRLYDELLSG